MAGIAAVHGAHEADVVHHAGNLRKDRADHGAGLAVLFEFEWGGQEGAGLGGDDARQGEGQRFAVVALKGRFVIKGVDLRRAAIHEKMNYRGSLGLMMCRLRLEVITLYRFL